MSRVVVLGAGPAGLLAGLEAAEAGHEVTILEAAPQVGGMAGSFEVAGQRVDYGSHRLHPATDPALMRRIVDLLGEDLQRRERNGRIRLRGRWVGFPLRAVDMARSLPPGFSAGVVADTLLAPVRRSGGMSFADEISRRLGPTIHDAFYGPYSQKLYGLASSELTAELAHKRVAAGSVGSVLRRVAAARTPVGRHFWYPKGGYGQIAEAVADAATAAGAELALGAPVDALRRSESWTVAAGERSWEADVVLSSIPRPVLARVLEPAPAVRVRNALDDMRTRAMVLVYLVVPQDHYTAFDAHYFPETEIRTARLSEPKNYRDGPDPRGQTVLCAEIACWVGDDVWRMAADDLGQLVVEDLARAGLPEPGVVGVDVRRLPSVYPVYEPRAVEARATVDQWADSLDGIVVFGRQGLGVPDNLHHVLAMGRGAAGVLDANGRIDRGAWARRRREFAAHVVQD